ncbi:MAG: sigma-54-dependent transcriptional regulator, partial [Planctomycetota bacterium]
MSIDKILVVDDDSLSRDYLSEALSGNDYEVESASDGHKAIKMVGNCNYDVVFLDMKMPGIGGLDVLEKIKKISKETIVIMVTAYGSIESAVAAMKNGAYDYIIKPFSLDQIEILLKRIQERQTLINENKYWRSRLDGNGDYEPVINKQSKMYRIYEDV